MAFPTKTLLTRKERVTWKSGVLITRFWAPHLQLPWWSNNQGKRTVDCTEARGWKLHPSARRLIIYHVSYPDMATDMLASAWEPGGFSKQSILLSFHSVGLVWAITINLQVAVQWGPRANIPEKSNVIVFSKLIGENKHIKDNTLKYKHYTYKIGYLVSWIWN